MALWKLKPGCGHLARLQRQAAPSYALRPRRRVAQKMWTGQSMQWHRRQSDRQEGGMKACDASRAVKEGPENRKRTYHAVSAPQKCVKSLLGISTDSESTASRPRQTPFRQPCGQACKRTRRRARGLLRHATGKVGQRSRASSARAHQAGRAMQGGLEGANSYGQEEVAPTMRGRRRVSQQQQP